VLVDEFFSDLGGYGIGVFETMGTFVFRFVAQVVVELEVMDTFEQIFDFG